LLPWDARPTPGPDWAFWITEAIFGLRAFLTTEILNGGAAAQAVPDEPLVERPDQDTEHHRRIAGMAMAWTNSTCSAPPLVALGQREKRQCAAFSQSPDLLLINNTDRPPDRQHEAAVHVFSDFGTNMRDIPANVGTWNAMYRSCVVVCWAELVLRTSQ
jgi:hypothetical protein